MPPRPVWAPGAELLFPCLCSGLPAPLLTQRVLLLSLWPSANIGEHSDLIVSVSICQFHVPFVTGLLNLKLRLDFTGL